MSVHTIITREHNRIATYFGEMTPWDGEQIYQETRKIIAAVLQFITYNEFLPLILSPKTVRKVTHSEVAHRTFLSKIRQDPLYVKC